VRIVAVRDRADLQEAVDDRAVLRAERRARIGDALTEVEDR
jgi:hypothetical protein